MQIQTTMTNSLLTGLTGYFQFGAILDDIIVNVFLFLFFPHDILFCFSFLISFREILGMVFLGKGYELWHGSYCISKHIFGSLVGTRKRCHPLPLILMGTRSYFLLMSFRKRHLHFISFSVEWTVLAFPTHPNGSLFTPVIHFGGSRKLQGSFSCRLSLLGAPQEEKQCVVDGGGCLLCSSLFIWLSWTCTFSERHPSWAA